MSKVMESKQNLVDEIATQLKESVSTVVVDYRGLTVAEMTELRKNLRDAGVEFKVYKNTMTRRAAEKAELTELNEFLTGPNAVAFSNESVIAPAKVIYNFAKEHEALEIKAGVIEGVVYDAAGMKAVADIPSREVLISKLLGSFKSPISSFARVISQVAEKKGEAAAE